MGGYVYFQYYCLVVFNGQVVFGDVVVGVDVYVQFVVIVVGQQFFGLVMVDGVGQVGEFVVFVGYVGFVGCVVVLYDVVGVGYVQCVVDQLDVEW